MPALFVFLDIAFDNINPFILLNNFTRPGENKKIH